MNHHKAEIVSTGKIDNTNFHVKIIAFGRAMSKQCENMYWDMPTKLHRTLFNQQKHKNPVVIHQELAEGKFCNFAFD